MTNEILDAVIKYGSLLAGIYFACHTFLKNKREDRDLFFKNQQEDRQHREKLANNNMETFFNALYEKRSNDLIKEVKDLKNQALEDLSRVLKIYK